MQSTAEQIEKEMAWDAITPPQFATRASVRQAPVMVRAEMGARRAADNGAGHDVKWGIIRAAFPVSIAVSGVLIVRGLPEAAVPERNIVGGGGAGREGGKAQRGGGED